MKQANSESSALLCRVYEQTGGCHLFQGSPIPTFVIDENHTVMLWNRACEQITGLRTDEMIGTKQTWKAFYPEPRPVLADLIISGASDEEINRHYSQSWQRSPSIDGAYESEAFFQKMGEDGTWLFFTASPLKDDKGRITGAIETLQDITGRKLAEADLMKYRDNLEEMVRRRTEELAQTHDELVAKAATLEQANEELSQYAFVASHDLRAPMRAVRNYSDFLRDELDPVLNDEQRSYFDGLGKALRHGDELVNDLLEFSRIGNLVIAPQHIDLGAFFCDLQTTLDQPEGTDLIFNGNWPTVVADRVLLNQIFQNLINNGLKFNRSPRRRVEVTLSGQQDETCEVCVHDNGIGIDPRYHDRIFKMFKRLHTHKEFEGTGIGLAIVMKAVIKLKGSVRLESDAGAGSSFFITLPLAEKETEL